MRNEILSHLVREGSKWLLAVVLFGGVAACQKENVCLTEDERVVMEAKRNAEVLLTDFAEVLSKATYARREVREFLREEALKQFDRNYDVLYALARDKKVGDETFRDILVAYSSEEEMDRIEAGLPLLNIFVPEISCFSICPENLDCEDAEIPVAVSKRRVTSLYVNGTCEVDLEKGEVPDFHTFVVNENSRVVVMPAMKGGAASVAFKSPSYDGTKASLSSEQSVSMTAEEVGERAVEAFRYYDGSSSDEHSRTFQRDYIYFGITPEDKKEGKDGAFHPEVSEYLAWIKINPRAYFSISDQVAGEDYDDPSIKKWAVSRKKKDFTAQELIDKMWTQGTYNFRIEVFSEKTNCTVVQHIPLRPEEIWDIKYQRHYRHGTWFRKKKYTYKIDPDDFVAKPVCFSHREMPLGGWNPVYDGRNKYVNLWEDDVLTYTMVGGVHRRIEEHDHLGALHIDFYDSIILEKDGSDKYLLHHYNTGMVEFALIAK